MPKPLKGPDDLYLAALLPRLTARARRLGHSPADAADLAQDVALQVWQRSRAGPPIADMSAYAMTALRNAANSAWRRQRATEELDEDAAATAPEAPVMLACAETRAAIDRLPPAQARLLHLVAMGETSPAALARLTGVPKGTVMSRLSRARAGLRAELGMRTTDSVQTLF